MSAAPATAAVAARVPRMPNFRLGTKKVFLPDSVITLIRKDKMPPTWAKFKVPLRFTKFDLRDYLWNLYGVEVTQVRSLVNQQAVSRKGARGPYYRPQSEKIMFVELVKPFEFPSPPTDLEPWNKALWDAREKTGEKQRKNDELRRKGRLAYPSKEPLDGDRKHLRAEAEQLLKGHKKWEGPETLDSKWDHIVQLAQKPKEAKKADGEAEVEKQSD